MLPHVPQLFTSVRRFTSQPSPAMPLQLLYPELHVPTMQPPPTHPSMATLGREQTLPHPLQLFGSVLVLTHVPLQLVVGGPQVAEHVPMLYTYPPGQFLPAFPPMQSADAPQYWLLVLGSMQVPPQLI